MNLIESELLNKFIAAIGTSPLTGFASYYQGEADTIPQDHCPALMVFAPSEEIASKDTASDIIRATLTVRAVVNVMQYVKETGTLTGYSVALSSVSGTFQVGETVTGATSAATATITAVDTNRITIGAWSASPTALETITGATSGATATLGAMAPVSRIQAQYQLRQLMAGRDSSTGEFLPNTVVGVLRNKAQLMGTFYKYNDNLKIEYRTIKQGDFFYVVAECNVTVVSELIRRPGF